MKLTVMTYNIYSGRTLEGAYDLSGKIETIRAVQPDLLGLNEVHQNTRHSGFTAQTDTIADALELPYRFFARAIDHDGGQYGIALLSRYPLLDAACVPIPDTLDENGRHPESRVHICAHIACGDKRIQVLTSHYGLSAPEQKNAVAETLRLRDPALPCVFMGDLNAEDTDPVLAPLLTHFQNCAASLPPEQRFTFRSDRPYECIDYIFVSDAFTVEDCRVPVSTASDHRPVAARLSLHD